MDAEDFCKKLHSDGVVADLGLFDPPYSWNSTGMGVKRRYEILEIFLCAHGGGHNDTICVAERKLPPDAAQERFRSKSSGETKMTDQVVFTPDQLVAYFIQARDQKAVIEARHKTELAPTHELMAMLEGALLKFMQDNNLTSLSTAAGTPYIKTHTSVKVVDWDVFFKFAMAQGQQGLLVHGANKASVEQFIEANKALPPGLDVRRVNVVNVRRAGEKE